MFFCFYIFFKGFFAHILLKPGPIPATLFLQCRQCRSDTRSSFTKPRPVRAMNSMRREDNVERRIFVAQERYYITGYTPSQGKAPRYGREKMERPGPKSGDEVYSAVRRLSDINRTLNGDLLIISIAEEVSYMTDYTFTPTGEISEATTTAVPISCMKKVFTIPE